MHSRLKRPLPDRLWPKVQRGEPGECWNWLGAKNGNGYGRIAAETGRRVYPHRVAWELTNGPIPAGLFACHSCDNPLCCNPAHIFIGTHTDNMRDMHAKGRNGALTKPERMARGDRHSSVTRPDRVPRGTRSGRYTKPECTARGEGHGMHKMTEHDVIDIRTLAAFGASVRSLSEAFGVCLNTIGNIVSRRHWRHVP